MKTTTLLIFTISIFISCTKPSSTTNMEVAESGKSYKHVDDELWIFFYNFEKEAEKRGLTIDLNDEGIIGSIDIINHGNVAGLCNYSAHDPNEVVLDEAFWARASDSKKELIVFHELGHCFLERPHRDENDSSGTCISIMRSGTGSCLDQYNTSSRSDYLDELFNQQ